MYAQQNYVLVLLSLQVYKSESVILLAALFVKNSSLETDVHTKSCYLQVKQG